jgi:hypothetical protein
LHIPTTVCTPLITSVTGSDFCSNHEAAGQHPAKGSPAKVSYLAETGGRMQQLSLWPQDSSVYLTTQERPFEVRDAVFYSLGWRSERSIVRK